VGIFCAGFALSVRCAFAAPSEHGGPLPWIADNPEHARALARESNRPIVVDFWAPWCHTCIAMKHGALQAESLAGFSGAFVWLAVDTDKPENAAFVAQFPPQAWPTFLVLGPDGETVLARLVGAATAEQFSGFLASVSPNSPASRAAAHRAAGRLEEAQSELSALVESLPAGSPLLPHALTELLSVLFARGDLVGCLESGARHADAAFAGGTGAAGDFSYFWIRCAEAVLANPTQGAPAKSLAHGALARAAKLLIALSKNQRAPLSVDDRSEVLRIARTAVLAQGDQSGARRVAKRQRQLLQRSIRAQPPHVAMLYNWPLCEVAQFLGELDAILPILRQSVAALPREYDPPHRLGWALLQLDRPTEALPHLASAAALAYGPRRARILGVLLDAQKRAQAPVDAQRDTAQALVSQLEAVPERLRDTKALAAAREELTRLQGAAQ
jgi:thiol-disulfide isomerase/thioredoxin